MNKLTSKQAAEYLGIQEATLRLWRINMRVYPLSCPTPWIPYRKMGKKVIYEIDALDEFIKAQTKGNK